MTDPTTTPTRDILSIHSVAMLEGPKITPCDLHLCPEGIFAIATPRNQPGCIVGVVGLGFLIAGTTMVISQGAPSAGIALLGLGGVLIVGGGVVATTQAKAWRVSTLGEPLDRLVEANPRSLWIAPGEIECVELAPSRLRGAVGLRVSLHGGRQLDFVKGIKRAGEASDSIQTLLSRAGELGWPVA